MTHIYTSNYGNRPGNPEYCRHSVHDGGRSVSFHQCNHKPSAFREIDGVKYGFCGIHDPVKVAEKDAVRQAAWEAKRNAEREHYARLDRRKKALPLLVNAMEEIAAGHNDARGLAAEILAAIGDVK